MEEQNFNNEVENEALSEESAENTSSEKKKKSAAKELLEWLQAIVIAVVLALVIRSFIFTVVRVDGQSMEPTLQHQDRMIVWRLGYEPKAGDIVVINPPAEFVQGGMDPKKVFWIKRVIATEGQSVEIDYKTNSVYVDGEKINEPYLNPEEPMIDPEANYPMEQRRLYSELTVPEGMVFVLGDNRNHSSDGRLIGPIDKESVIGTACLRFWPFSSIEVDFSEDISAEN